MAIAELHGPAAGLATLDGLDASRVEGYQPYHAARADVLARAGQVAAAVAAYDEAIALTVNSVERRFLIEQRDRAGRL